MFPNFPLNLTSVRVACVVTRHRCGSSAFLALPVSSLSLSLPIPDFSVCSDLSVYITQKNPTSCRPLLSIAVSFGTCCSAVWVTRYTQNKCFLQITRFISSFRAWVIGLLLNLLLLYLDETIETDSLPFPPTSRPLNQCHLFPLRSASAAAAVGDLSIVIDRLIST